MPKPVSRSALCRKFFARFPDAKPSAAIAYAKVRGVIVSTSLANQVLYKMRHGRPDRRKEDPLIAKVTSAERKTRVDEMVERTVYADHLAKHRQVRANGTVMVEHILAAHALAKRVGGVSKAKAAIELLEQLA